MTSRPRVRESCSESRMNPFVVLVVFKNSELPQRLAFTLQFTALIGWDRRQQEYQHADIEFSGFLNIETSEISWIQLTGFQKRFEEET